MQVLDDAIRYEAEQIESSIKWISEQEGYIERERERLEGLYRKRDELIEAERILKEHYGRA